jgi:hypothetical protein
LVIFPHHREELDRYGEYIETLFGATLSELHNRVISYDWAVCGMVGEGESSILLNIQSFQHLYTAIMLPGGIKSSKAS